MLSYVEMNPFMLVNMSQYFRLGACSLLQCFLAQEVGTMGVNHAITNIMGTSVHPRGEKGVGGAGESNHRKASPDDVTLEHALG